MQTLWQWRSGVKTVCVVKILIGKKNMGNTGKVKMVSKINLKEKRRWCNEGVENV
jgi:hypothetical protein